MISQKQEEKIYRYLFRLKKYSDDIEGVVCACLVDEKGKVLVSSPSFRDGCHAEAEVIKKAKKKVSITDKLTLYTTLEPCSMRKSGRTDCTILIIKAKIKNVVYAAKDPDYSKDTRKRLKKAGINYRQVHNNKLIRQSTDLFNFRL